MSMPAKFGRSLAIATGEGSALSSALLRARVPAEVAAAWFEHVPALHEAGACLLWSTHWPRDMQAYPEGATAPRIAAAAVDAVSRALAVVVQEARLQSCIAPAATSSPTPSYVRDWPKRSTCSACRKASLAWSRQRSCSGRCMPSPTWPGPTSTCRTCCAACSASCRT